MLCHHLCINPKKTVFLPISRQKEYNTFLPVHLDDVTIDPSECTRNLGFIFDSKLSHKFQVASLRKQCFYHLKRIRNIRNMIPENMFMSLVHAFITSRLDFCNSLFFGSSKQVFARLQNVQTAVAKCVLRRKRFDSSHQTLADLHWLPIEQRVFFKTSMIGFKIISGQAPSYLRDEVFIKTSARHTRSSNEILLTHTSSFKPRLKSCGERTFLFSIVKTWNSLPNNIRAKKSFSSFKSALKTHIFKATFR